MTHRSIDEYGNNKKKEIATRDQLKKSEAVLEPLVLSLGFSFKEKTEEIEDIQKLRDDMKRLNEGMSLMADNLTRLESLKQHLEARLELFTFMFYCPNLKKKITSIDCQKAILGGYCSHGSSCAVRVLEFKKFLELE